LCRAAQIAPAEHRRNGLELNRRRRRVAFCGEGPKDRRGKSKVGEIAQGGDALSLLGCRQCVRMNAMRGRETIRAIRAVQISAGDKDRSGFHRVGGSLRQARSRDSTEEHEHCTPNMLADLPGSSACGILGRARTRRRRRV
jgi:hypothetical protein